MKKILFVCMGNLCRSPIAQAVATHLAHRRGLEKLVSFGSAGTYPPSRGAPADPRAVRIGQARGYDLSQHRTRRVEAADFSRFDLILAADEDNLQALRQKCPAEYLERLALLLSPLDDASLQELPDPYYGNSEGFERVFDLCEAGIEALFKKHRDFRVQ